jgi:HAD superfamily hydrolase (TIGR01484 family)
VRHVKKLSELSKESWSGISVLLTDIDDTITTEGRLTSEAYNALEALQKAGYIVIPVTGRCAGWCDHIARMWPVNAIVGENGAFYFRYDHNTKTMTQYFCQSEVEREENAKRLKLIGENILVEVPGSGIASDQPYRLTDFAVDFSEDVTPLPTEEVKRIVTLAEVQGATAKISSIHVNCWFGDHSKLAMSLTLLKDCFDISENEAQNIVTFVGDSPNDETMFGHFQYSIGVANILESRSLDFQRPAFVTQGKGGAGFAEVASYLLNTKN